MIVWRKFPTQAHIQQKLKAAPIKDRLMMQCVNTLSFRERMLGGVVRRWYIGMHNTKQANYPTIKPFHYLPLLLNRQNGDSS
jgi:hypothetical protein